MDTRPVEIPVGIDGEKMIYNAEVGTVETCGTCQGEIGTHQHRVRTGDGTPHHLWGEECGDRVGTE